MKKWKKHNTAQLKTHKQIAYEHNSVSWNRGLVIDSVLPIKAIA